jgi:hypothetical protein
MTVCNNTKCIIFVKQILHHCHELQTLKNEGLQNWRTRVLYISCSIVFSSRAIPVASRSLTQEPHSHESYKRIVLRLDSRTARLPGQGNIRDVYNYWESNMRKDLRKKDMWKTFCRLLSTRGRLYQARLA